MIDINEQSTLDRLADLIADRIALKLAQRSDRVLVSREELAALTGLGVRTIDRMAAGGSDEKIRGTENRVWRASSIKLDPIKQGSRVMFDKAAALAAIKAGG